MFLKQTHRCPLSAKNCQPLRIFKFNYTFKQESCQILFCHTQRYCFAMHTSTVLPYTPVLLCHTQRQRFVIHNGTGVPYAKVLFCLAQQKTVILIDNVYQYTDNKTRGKTMATAQTQIRIDSNIKKQASDLFATLGLDLSSAVNLFLRQCIMREGLPFAVELPHYSKKTMDAMEEARRISSDTSVPAYKTMEEFKAALED